VIGCFQGKYEPKLYAYYSSLLSATVRETARGGSMLKVRRCSSVLAGRGGRVVAFGAGSPVRSLTSGLSLKAPAPPPLPHSNSLSR
jgi:hypothetical protein